MIYRTGLNSYLLRTLVGELVYDLNSKTTGHSTTNAQCWLWRPEAVADEVARLLVKAPWAVKLTAERAR